MRLRTLILFAIALLLAGGTAILVRSWLSQRPTVAAVAPAPRPAPQKSIMVARAAIARGQILKPADFTAQPWPDAAITGDYVVAGTGPATSLVGAVAREPIAAGEPIIKTKIVVPGDRGFLAAVLQPGMRAVSVPVDTTTDVSGFVFAGDRVDILITLPVPQDGANGNSGYQHKAAETVLHDVRVIAPRQQGWPGDGGPQCNLRGDAEAERDHHRRQRNRQAVAEFAQPRRGERPKIGSSRRRFSRRFRPA
jgi:pilus assembly protein CpaB